MDTRNQRLCAWCGPAFMVLFFVGFGVIARFIPPPSPSASAQAVSTMYHDHATAIRMGMVVSMFALVFYVPWVGAISVQLKRIEGRHTPLTFAQLGLGAGLPVAFFPALYFFETAAFRPERSAQLVQTLNDMGWLPFTGIIYAIFLENIVIGLAVLSDKRDEPILPRWFAWFNFVVAVLYLPACLDVLSTHGPLAWNGLWSWWLSLTAFFLWLVVTTVLEMRAIRRQHGEAATSSRRAPLTSGHRDAAATTSAPLEERIEALSVEIAAVRRELAGSIRSAPDGPSVY